MNKSSSKKSIYQISLSSLFLALAVVFASISKYVLPFLHLPNGGSISLVMVPLTLAVLILGPLYGLFVSLTFALINLVFDNGFAYNYLSLILDYFLAFSTCLVCTFFRKKYYQNKISSLFLSILCFSFLRFICHFFSGVLISWQGDVSLIAPNFEINNIIYSLVYNLTYIVPSFVLSTIVLLSISKPLFQLNSTMMLKTLNPYNDDSYYQKEDYSFIKIVSSISLISLISSIISTIPYKYQDILSIYYLGYITLVSSTTLIVLISLNLIKDKRIISFKNKEIKIRDIDIFLFVINIIIFALSLTSILSYFTYGYNIYH